MLRRWFLATLSILTLLAAFAAQADYLPKAEALADGVYAIVGPLGQRIHSASTAFGAR